MCTLKSLRSKVGELSERKKVNQDSWSEIKVERLLGGQYRMASRDVKANGECSSKVEKLAPAVPGQ